MGAALRGAAVTRAAFIYLCGHVGTRRAPRGPPVPGVPHRAAERCQPAAAPRSAPGRSGSARCLLEVCGSVPRGARALCFLRCRSTNSYRRVRNGTHPRNHCESLQNLSGDTAERKKQLLNSERGCPSTLLLRSLMVVCKEVLAASL